MSPSSGQETRPGSASAVSQPATFAQQGTFTTCSEVSPSLNKAFVLQVNRVHRNDAEQMAGLPLSYYSYGLRAVSSHPSSPLRYTGAEEAFRIWLCDSGRTLMNVIGALLRGPEG